jgi:hypothetical protein
MIKALLAVSILSLSSSGFAKKSTEATLLREDEGITVKSRPVKGYSADELIAVGEFDAPPEEVFALLWDIPAQKEFVAPVKDASNVSESKTSRIDHVVFDAGLPGLKDRDVVSELKIKEKSAQKIWLKFKQKEDVGPAPSDKYVRLTLREGDWELTPLDEGTRTKALYRLRIDPGSAVGHKAALNFAAKTIIVVYKAMRKKLK